MVWHWLIKLYMFQIYNSITRSVTIYPSCALSYLPPYPFPSGNHHIVISVYEFLTKHLFVKAAIYFKELK